MYEEVSMACTIQNPSTNTSQTIQCQMKSIKPTHVSVEQVGQTTVAVQGRRPRRRMSFEEAKAATFTQFDETFRRLADAG
jgi:hypothetical protein